MFKPILTRLLNHLISQNSWARKELRDFGGKSILFRIPPVSATLTILEDGGLAIAGETAAVDATITVPPTIALRLLAKDETATTLVDLQGDTELATALAKVLQNISWDYEEDLSKVIGDIPAHQVSEFARKASSEVKKQSINIAEMFAEYWQEEEPLIAKKRHVEKFNNEVDTLRDDMERMDKRLEKITDRLSAITGLETPSLITEKEK
ncbi:hypothetical protein A7981_03000 [Methylovorus sp. MM2]|uniref:ubiquinone biosynthesis accessory factor UbiJ n=1 Tax=Methylovorus sp. MM2 TaxID=1848038 RepID=UPI0007E1B118|nr:SCP2 sterol-binding domain-containing protein [Methylovorus sp. MM2]OAM52461.1 hypothetical protein A7981_03000 [Methylovorus sp. MM2]